jgi:serine/threonine protein kinase
MSSSDDNLPAVKATEPLADPDPRELVGSTVDDRYRILEFIGQGGMGNVYKAEHVTIRRPVALKLLHPALATLDAIRKRFEREAFAIGRIDHPNCVNVSDFGKLQDGSLYLVMEYLQGESLGDRLDRDRRILPRRALHITRHVLRGLGHAHRAGIVHRDVKPENVFLLEQEDDAEFAKILDFGIAKLIGVGETGDLDDKLTQAGVAFGTPIYLSPEQAVGDPADPRSDLYSVTVMLFEMIAGQPPFYSEDKLQILAMHTSRLPPRLSDIAPYIPIPDGVEELIQRGLTKQPSQRYIDAVEYIAAIDQIIEPFSEHTPPNMRLSSQSDVNGSGQRAGSEPASGEHARPTPRPTPRPMTPHRAATPAVTPSPDLTAQVQVDVRNTRDREATPAAFGANIPAPSGRNVIVLLLVAIGIAIGSVVVFSGGSDRKVPASAPETAKDPSVAQQVKKAEEELAEGDPEQSIQHLRSQSGIADNSEGQLHLGHAYATKSEYAQALSAYARAVQLDRGLGADPRMQTNLRLMIDDDGPVFAQAARLLFEYARDPSAKDTLVELAEGKDPVQRAEAFRILEGLGLDGEIDRVKAFSWDLKQGETCDKRKEAVAKLRALGDKRAIAALETTLVKKARRANRCMLQHAEDAVRYLQSLPAEAARARAPANPD